MKIKNFFILWFLFIFILFNTVEASNEPLINLRIVNGLISLECKDAKVEKLIAKISEEMGIGYKVYENIKGKIVTTKFEMLNFEEAIKKVVSENYAIVYSSNNSHSIEKLYVLSRGKQNKQRFELIEKYHNDVFPSLTVLRRIVDRQVIKEHPNAKFYDCIPHKHLDGTLLSYVFIYYIGSGNAPDKDTLENIITNAWQKKKIAIQNIEEGYRMRDSAKTSSALTSSKEASTKISQENNFVSLEIGADYTAPPVIAAWQGLPIDISQYPRALDTAHERIGDKNPVFKCVYTTGLFASVFAFEGDDKTYYIEPDNWQIFTSWKKVGKDFRYEGKNDEERRRNKLKWESFLDI